MKRHTKIYFKHFGYSPDEWIACEVRAEGCTNTATDIMHIDHAGIGGKRSARLDVIENLVAGCRNCHTKHHNGKICKWQLLEIVRKRNHGGQ